MNREEADALLAETVRDAKPGATIRLPHRDMETPSPTLPELDVSDADGGGEYRLGELLGEGGMAIVRSATQFPFRREVALKIIRGRADKRGAQNVLREAIVTGRLEHPNIVPVYAVGRDASEKPVIVMKRIAGSSWREVLDAAEQPLRWHLRTLLRVCAAVTYAHEHAIVHGDIKPDNVMIGAHDDVYLLDWGIAVSLDPGSDMPARFVGDVGQVCGTPKYMAPEMTTGGEEPLDERTDVYLLGAVLHEVVTGTGRHGGETVFMTIMAARRSPPVAYGEEVPAELAEICNRATCRQAAERFQTVDELRDAVQAYLDHRSAAELTQQASEQLVRLQASLDAGLPGEVRRVEVYQLYGAARFGFERSLSEWAEQPLAVAGLQHTLELMVVEELSHGSVAAARALIAALPEPNEELRARVRSEEASQEAERSELAHLRAERRGRDASIGARNRAWLVGLTLGASFVLPAMLMVTGLWDPSAGPRELWLVGVAAGSLVLGVLGGVWRAGFAIERTVANRQILSVVGIATIWFVAMRTLALFLLIPLRTELVTELIGFAAFAAAIGVTLDRRVLPSSGVWGAAALVSLAYPAHAMWLFLAGNALALLLIAVSWTRAGLQGNAS